MELLGHFTLTYAHQTSMEGIMVAILVHMVDQNGSKKSSPVQSKLLMSLQSSIFRIKAFYGHISCTLLILQTIVVPLREYK